MRDLFENTSETCEDRPGKGGTAAGGNPSRSPEAGKPTGAEILDLSDYLARRAKNSRINRRRIETLSRSRPARESQEGGGRVIVSPAAKRIRGHWEEEEAPDAFAYRWEDAGDDLDEPEDIGAYVDAFIAGLGIGAREATAGQSLATIDSRGPTVIAFRPRKGGVV